MADINGLEDLDDELVALETSLGGATTMASAFESELLRVQHTLLETGKDIGDLERSISKGLRKAFDGLVFDGMRLSDALNTVAMSMVNSAYNAAITPITDHFGALIGQGVNALVEGIFPNANGNAFSQGRVMPFAKGGVVSGPVTFPMKGATGLMGEAGPEAIMPLTRGSDGRLGVRAEGGGAPVNVVMNITTPDVQGFQRSQSQIAAQVTRVLGQAQRNA